MKEGWNEINMVDACDILTCGVASTPKYVDENVGVPFLSAQNVRNGEIVLDKYKYISQEFHEHLTKKNKPQRGDILYSRVGAKYGEAGVVELDFEFSVYVSVTLIRPKAELLNNYYFKYYLNSPRIKDLARKSIQSSGVPNLNVKAVREFPIPIPPFPEQQQIVSILDKAFAAIDQAKANTERNLQNVKDLFQSELSQIFTQKGEDWEEKAIKDLTSIVTKGSSPKWQGVNYVDSGGIFFLTSKNVGEGELLLDNKKYLEERFNEIQKKSILRKGDVLTNIVGASIGRTAIFDLDEITNINQAVCLMRCKSKIIHNYYLMYLLNSPFFKSILHDNEVDNARANLSLTFFKNLIIPLPLVTEQREIVNKIELFLFKTKKLEKKYQQKLINLEELKKSLLQKAFSGELVSNRD